MQIHESPTAISTRATNVAGYLIGSAHWAVGLLWVVITLFARSLRDCFLTECGGTTAAEGSIEAFVWALGILTWIAVGIFLVRSLRSTRIYWGIGLVPAWFLVATFAGAGAILGSAS